MTKMVIFQTDMNIFDKLKAIFEISVSQIHATKESNFQKLKNQRNSILWFALGFKAAAAAANVSRHDSKGGGKYPNGVATVGGGTVLLGTNEGI